MANCSCIFPLNEVELGTWEAPPVAAMTATAGDA